MRRLQTGKGANWERDFWGGQPSAGHIPTLRVNMPMFVRERMNDIIWPALRGEARSSMLPSQTASQASSDAQNFFASSTTSSMMNVNPKDALGRGA